MYVLHELLWLLLEVTWQHSFIHKYLLPTWYAQSPVAGSMGATKMNNVYKLPHQAQSWKHHNPAEAGFERRKSALPAPPVLFLQLIHLTLKIWSYKKN